MYRIPRYLNQPTTHLFDLEIVDIAILYFAFFYGQACGYIYLLVSLGGAIWLIWKKRNSPQGYFKHMLYYAALYKLDNYPKFSENEFLE